MGYWAYLLPVVIYHQISIYRIFLIESVFDSHEILLLVITNH